MNASLCALLDDYLAGDLPDAEARAFEQHLDHCAACTEEVRLQSAIDRVLADSRPQAPPELQRRVAESLDRRRVQRFARVAIAAGLLLACAAGGWRVWMAARSQPHESRISQDDDVSPMRDRPAALQPVADRPPPASALPAARVAVDAGNKAIVVSQPTADPTVHIFWVYPTVDVSMNARDETTIPPEPERNSL